MPCFEVRDDTQLDMSALASAFRESFTESILHLSVQLLEIIVRYAWETPWLVWFHAQHLMHSQWCCCTKFCRGPRRRFGLGEGVLDALAVICFAPHFVPLRLWRAAVPRPCRHHRCALRSYVSPPSPWHRRLRSSLYQSIQATCLTLRLRQLDQHQPPPFPIFRLPVEIRNLIYLHASSASKHEIRVTGAWTTSDPQVTSYGRATTSPSTSGYDARCHRGHEDAISYQLDNTAIIAYHGTPPPPTNLLLACKQMYEEVRDQFLSTTAFEVQPLTPNDASWRLDYSLMPTYDALLRSTQAPFMRKILVRIDLARFCMARQTKRFPYATAPVCTFQGISLEKCAWGVAVLARRLCSVLQRGAPSLRVVEIHWTDDFPEAVDDRHLRLRRKILAPFVDLRDVRVRVRRLVMVDQGRMAVMAMMHHMLGTDVSARQALKEWKAHE